MTYRLALIATLLTGCTLYGDDDAAAPLVCDQDFDTIAYRIDEIDVPATNDEARGLGWDLDGDGVVDNQGGAVIAAIDNAIDVDLQAAVSEALEADLVQIVIRRDSCGEPDFEQYAVIRGLEIDRSGERPVVVGDDVTTTPAVFGDVGSPIVATGGVTRFPVGQLIHPVADDWIDARELVIEVDAGDRFDVLTGRLSAALDADQVYAVVTRAFQAKVVERQEELGPCTPDACDDVLRTLLEIFDTDNNGGVDLAEVRANSLMQTLLAADLDLDADGTPESYSLGVGFRATWVDL